MNATTFLYRWKIRLGKERQFEENWTTITLAMREQCGSYGSRLHVTQNGEYIAYAQWPDAEARLACVLDSSSNQARAFMREAVEVSYPEEQLFIQQDLLLLG